MITGDTIPLVDGKVVMVEITGTTGTGTTTVYGKLVTEVNGTITTDGWNGTVTITDECTVEGNHDVGT